MVKQQAMHGSMATTSEAHARLPLAPSSATMKAETAAALKAENEGAPVRLQCAGAARARAPSCASA